MQSQRQCANSIQTAPVVRIEHLYAALTNHAIINGITIAEFRLSPNRLPDIWSPLTKNSTAYKYSGHKSNSKTGLYGARE